ncbi:RHS repeat-associated core domain-containing protein [Sinomicrobium oceani]|uniref:RHS repeat-associated core domain-containing protein n=1 Tax=Sinomicrobium oceani TaxID=1150368 RepID=A0A1K1RVU9_9FLAO|nr:DUF6443 domain-containing protein [Sinomicrobium oceani]SFW76217.1 RHS repeat-associated core domain-containing protein [Sinomicrobium oceani]
MKTKLLFLYFVFSVSWLFAQDPPATIVIQDDTLQSGQTRNYIVTQSITLKPNTWLRAGSTFSAKVISDAYIPLAISNTENYILTRSYQMGLTSSAGITENKDVIDKVIYYDGLGRPKQEVAVRASNDKHDIITHIEYDSYGRQVKEYLPYRAGQNKGQFNGSALSQTNSFYDTTKYENTTNPYTEKVFEPSPLNVVEEIAPPGVPWKADPSRDSDHTIKYKHTTNANEEVRLYEVSLTSDFTPSLVASGYYTSRELYVTITKDENWQPADGDNRTTKEYKDKQGRIVLKRTYNSGAHDTYYVYDDYGNLTYVLPPKVNTGSSITATVLNELCYQYKYDERNRLVEKKIPGKGWEYIVYNLLDQPVMTQDAKLQADKKWLFTKYDAFGRVAYTGFHHSESTRAALQNTANDTDTYEQYVSKTGTPTTYAGTPVYYNNAAIPQGMAEIHTVNYYDNYTFDLAGLTVPTTVLGQTVDTQTKTLATGSKTRVLDTNHWITTISAYDKKGRLIYTATKNPYLNTADIVESKLDFAGKVLETRTTHTKGSNAAIVTIDKFEYDHMGRLLIQTQKINNQAEELIAENVYDELGQLEQKKVGNTKSKPLQTIDYTYNIRGWLKGMNNPATLGNSLFAFRIGYNEGSNPLYNGNIALTQWKTKNQDQGLKTYNYTYDALNRIKTAIHSNNNYSLLNVNYDKNGNIIALKRNGHVNAGATSFGLMDDLSYTYHNGGNFLVKVSDAANTVYGFKDGTNTDNDYARDANGNTTRDRNKGITGITYNYLNLPTQVSFGSNKIVYIYDALGTKLKKEVTQGSSVTATEYAGNYIYENGQLQFFSHPEGYVTKESGTYTYIYQYKDHLGNVRLSYANTGTTSTPQLEMIEENNYYPFGFKHKGYNGETSSVGNSVAQKWKYNGKELEEELNLNVYDFHARNYMPDIGRTLTLDPLAEDFYTLSSYSFQNNNPVFFVDPTGKSALEWVKVKNEYIWDDRVTDQATAEQYQGEDAKYVGANATVSTVKNGETVDSVTLNNDGSVTQGEATLGVNSKQVIANAYGSTFKPKQTGGDYLQISAGFAFLGGFGIAFGIVNDAVGNSNFYFNFDGNIGLGLGVSLDSGTTTPTGTNQFLTSNFAGNSSSYNAGITVMGIDASRHVGGSIHDSWHTNDKMNTSKFGDHRSGYRTNQGGLGIGRGLRLSAMYSYGTTTVFK